MPGQESTKDLVNGSIPGLRCPICGSSSREEGLTGPLFLSRAGMSLPCGVWAVALGKGGVLAQTLNRNPRGALGCLPECVEPGRGFWWGSGSQAQVGENLDDYGRIFNGGEDGQWATALWAGGDVDDELGGRVMT